MKRRNERRLSRVLELLIVVLVGLVALEVLSQRDPFECRTTGQWLTDEDLARESLAFVRSEQFDNDLAPGALPDGYDISDVDALLADPRFAVEITRYGDGPGGLLKDRSWLERQVSGARLAVRLTLPADTPGAPMLGVLHISDPCGKVRIDAGYGQNGLPATPPPRGTE